MDCGVVEDEEGLQAHCKNQPSVHGQLAGISRLIPANISDISGLVSSGRLPIDLVLLQVSGPAVQCRARHRASARGDRPSAVGHRASQPRIAVDPWSTTFSADEPERLRGPQHDAAWCDELGAWRYPEAWDMLMFGCGSGPTRVPW